MGPRLAPMDFIFPWTMCWICQEAPWNGPWLWLWCDYRCRENRGCERKIEGTWSVLHPDHLEKALTRLPGQCWAQFQCKCRERIKSADVAVCAQVLVDLHRSGMKSCSGLEGPELEGVDGELLLSPGHIIVVQSHAYKAYLWMSGRVRAAH